jgi:hypothetical protein
MHPTHLKHSDKFNADSISVLATCSWEPIDDYDDSNGKVKVKSKAIPVTGLVGL